MWAEAIVIFGLCQWYIAIFLWTGLYIINYYIFKRKFKNRMEGKDCTENFDGAFLNRVFLSSLICVFLPDIFSAIEISGVVLKYSDKLWVRYFNNALCLAGILFVFYSIGFRPWSWKHGLHPPGKKSEDKIDKADKIIDAVICTVIFFLVQIIYAIFYFK